MRGEPGTELPEHLVGRGRSQGGDDRPGSVAEEPAAALGIGLGAHGAGHRLRVEVVERRGPRARAQFLEGPSRGQWVAKADQLRIGMPVEGVVEGIEGLPGGPLRLLVPHALLILPRHAEALRQAIEARPTRGEPDHEAPARRGPRIR
jgi:hypothetical protein